jgi:membrane-associated protease RseP (regulator of RpoE activity)
MDEPLSRKMELRPEEAGTGHWDGQSALETTRAVVDGDLSVESVEIPRQPRLQGVLILRGRLQRPSHQVFPRWLERLNREGYTPLLRPEGSDSGQVALHIMPFVAPRTRPRIWINLLLFLVTLASTLFVGAAYGATTASFNSLADLWRGVPFAATLLGILAAHEFGHYFAARYHRVAVTLPYFLPMPLGFGTLGAFIQLKEPVPDRRKLFDIGVAGPLAGLILAVPLLFLGLSTSEVTRIDPGVPVMLEGNSLLYYYAKILVFGQPLPDPLTGLDVMMNQVTFAAWIGLLVTALNLLPMGQLDGGHTVFGLFGEKARAINLVTVGLMATLAVAGLEPLQQMFPALSSVGYTGWFIWLVLIMFLGGPFHPPALDDVTELDSRRRLVGYLVILIFIVTFVPVPMTLIGM